METHPEPEKALSDGPNSWPLHKMQALLETLIAIDKTVKQQDFIEDAYL
jgi:2-dehydro-3-deoxyphosphooctonate aldolase (KDO 8-P synthase)